MNKIVFISRKYCRGEAWCNRLLAYAKGFQRQGVDVELLFLMSNEQSKSASDDFEDLTVRYISEFSDRDNLLKKIVLYTKAVLTSSLFFNSGDILITSDGGGLFLPLLFLRRKKNYTFTEITEHPLVLDGSMYVSGIFGIIKRRLRHFSVSLENLLIRKNTGIFAISDSLCNYFLSHEISSDKICKVNMFVDTKRFDIVEETTDPYIAYCGTMSYDKDGVDILIKAFSLFLSDAPKYKLYLIGPYINKQTQEQTEELIRTLKLEKSVVVTGKVAPIQMPRLLKNARILALARPDNLQNRNGFPTKLGEYLATGNPVVVTSIGEIPNFLKDEENAFMATPGNVQSFADALKRAYNNSEKAIAIGRNGRHLALTAFSSEEQTKVALNFIKTKINKK